MRVPRISPPFAGVLLVVGMLAPAGVAAVDPEGSWADAGSVTAPRYFTTATRLPNGTVLVAGGQDGQGEIADVRLYDPPTNTWSAGTPLTVPRSRHTATLLEDGTVFVAGGLTMVPGARNALASTTIYDPTADSWSAGTPMHLTHYLHTATELADHRVLVVGGIGGADLSGQSSFNQASADLYDPATATWSAVPNMAFYRYGHTATMLPNGKVLVAGGEGSAVVGGCGQSCGEILDSAELYDPITNTWTSLPDMHAAHAFGTATLLSTGQVIVAGGNAGRFPPDFNDTATETAELFDPVTNTWSLATPMATARSEHVAGLLPDGRVLLVGGFASGVGGIKSAEIYNPVSDTWSSAGDMSTTRWFPSAVALDDGSVLVVGGAGGPSFTYLASAERYTSTPTITFMPAPGAPATVARMGRFEQQFQLDRTYGTEVNDPTVIDVTGRFVSPTGAIFTVPAYFGLDYTVQPGTGVASSENYLPVALDPPADGIWHVRFSPDEVGTWTYTLHAQDHVAGQETTATSAQMMFDVTASSAHGQVTRDRRDNRFLRYQDGTPYYPMGHNVAFQQGEPVGNDGEHYSEPLFASMEAAGQNWTRIWMTDFNRNALEWSSGHWAGWYTGVGHYAAQSAFRIERQLDVAEEHGLQVQLVLNDHGQVSNRGLDRWNENPYNAANGGPVDAAHPEAFFTNAEARELFKHRLHYLVARYGAYRNVLAWELFNEAQFVGSDAVNPSNNAQIRADIVAWHAEMAAYLRSIDPYEHLITTSSDIESSLKDIWADPNIDLVQVHDYLEPVTTRDTRFRGYVTSLNAAYQKPVIIGEFGIFQDPEINFDPEAAAPLDDREEHLLQSTHLHNAAWAAAMSGSGAMSWWWGAYIHSSPAHNRVPPEFPANERVNPPLRDFFAGEDLAGMSLQNSVIAAPATVVALGLDNGSRGFAWIRDAQNEYGTGAGPGDLAGRTMSGVRVNVAGFADGTYRIEIHDPWDVQPTVERLATSVGGTLSIPLPDFTRDIALKIRPVGAATAGQPVTVAVASPNGGPVDVIESTTPASPPAGSGYTYLAFQLRVTAPPATTATPLTLTFTVDKALLDSVDPDLTADTLSVFRNDVPVASCTAITTDPPATPDPCVSARETLVGGADAGDVRITVLSSTASRWNFGIGPARANQTISFGNLANKTMLQSPVTVTASASSGLTVSFSTTTPSVCTSGGPSGQTVTLIGAGTCTVKADQAGNAAYSPAPSVSRSFTVSRVSQSITFNAPGNRTMLQTPFTVSATASSLLPVSFASTTPSICTTSGATGSTVDLLSPGTCTIVASQAGNATYSPAPDKPRSFTVSLARQVITFTSPGNKMLIQSPVTITATSTSPLPVIFSTTTPAVCTSGGTNGSTITLLAVGQCSVVANQPATSVYSAATPVTRTFAVSLATQTITFGPLPTRHILQSPFTVSATASSQLTVTFATSSGSVCTAGGPNGATITLLKAGTCKVVASQAGNATYKAAPNVTQSFTVTTAKLAQTITFAPLADRSIGAPPLTLTATASSGLPVSYAVAPASAAVCSVSGSVLTLHDPGACTITASQSGSPSYNAATPVTRTLTATLEGFVQASGTSLVLDGQPFQIFGAAIYQTSNHGHTADPDQIFGWAHDAHLNTLRLTDIFLQTTNDPNAPYAEADWQWIDGLIARANDEGLKVILDLSSYRNWLVWSAEIDHGWVTNCQPNADRSPVDYAALDPYTVAHRADWTQFMTFVANRVNTVSGIKYRNDPTILVVSIAGEPIGPGFGECGRATSEQELTDFFEWALAEWKSLDRHHLRSNGGLTGTYAGLDGNGDPIPSGQQVDGIAIFSLADNTLPSLHTYPPRTTELPLADGQTPVLAPVAQDLGKPWFTEEFGFMQDDTDEFRASEFDFVYDEQTQYGSAGSLFWNLGPEVGLGTFDVNPSTPLTWDRVLAEAP